MNLLTNGGDISTNLRCNIRNLSLDQDVWFHPDYITNVLSLGLLKQQFRITYNSSKGGAFVVHRPGQPNMYFNCHSNGLHLIECGTNQFAFVSTVAGNMQGYSKRQIRDAQRAIDLKEAIGCPTTREFRRMIKENMLKNRLSWECQAYN